MAASATRSTETRSRSSTSATARERSAALETYRVVISPAGDGVDLPATAGARRGIRAIRLGVEPERVPEPLLVDDGPSSDGVRLTDRSTHAGGFGGVAGAHLEGVLLCRVSTRWREGAHQFAIALSNDAARALHPI